MGWPAQNREGGLKGQLGRLIQEHSGSDTEHWKDPSQRCSPQDHKPDKSDCQWTQRFCALEPGKGVSVLQSQKQIECANNSHFSGSGVTWSATVATGFTFLCASELSATAASRLVTTSQRTGGWHGRQPIFFMVFHASMALCRSIRRWVIGTGGLGGLQL